MTTDKNPRTEALWKLVQSIEEKLENSWAADARKKVRLDLAIAWRDLSILLRVRNDGNDPKPFDSRFDDPAIKIIPLRLTWIERALDQYDKSEKSP